MIKTIFCLRRLANLSLEEFLSHWLEYHGPIAARGKSLRRYVQYHALADDPSRKLVVKAELSTVEPFDGFAVTWTDSIEALSSTLESSAEGIEDDTVFIDMMRSVFCMTQEQVIVEPESSVPEDFHNPSYVFIECLRRRSDLDRAGFQKAWLHHGEFARSAHSQRLLTGYIQSHTLLGDAGRVEGLGSAEEPFDGLAFTYFDSIAKFKLMASQIATRERFEEEKNFIDF
jgi:hypothetical protein